MRNNSNILFIQSKYLFEKICQISVMNDRVAKLIRSPRRQHITYVEKVSGKPVRVLVNANFDGSH